jgi:hypothetical protein
MAGDGCLIFGRWSAPYGTCFLATTFSQNCSIEMAEAILKIENAESISSAASEQKWRSHLQAGYQAIIEECRIRRRLKYVYVNGWRRACEEIFLSREIMRA